MLVGRVHRLVLIACFGACMTQVAAATDMGVFSLTPPSPQNKDWSGFYSRSGSSDGPGPSWMNSTGMNSTSFSSPGAASRPATTSDESFGYNFQKGNFVFGVEGSFSAANFDGKFTSPNFTAAGAWSPNMNWLGTVTGRFGYSFGQWLPYVKGGFAAASVARRCRTAQSAALPRPPRGRHRPAGPPASASNISCRRNGRSGLNISIPTSTTAPAAALRTRSALGGSPEVYTTAVKSQSLLGRLNYKAGW